MAAGVVALGDDDVDVGFDLAPGLTGEADKAPDLHALGVGSLDDEGGAAEAGCEDRHLLVEEDFERVFIVAPLRAAQRAAGAVDVTLEEDEAEMLRGSSVDLAAPVLEELSLMIDPYPRTPGAAFEGGMAAPSAEESPFAVLQALKDKLEPPEKT